MFVISGVSGHVGSVAAHKLLDEKQGVRVIVRSAAQGAPWQAKGAEALVGSLEDEGFLTEALKDAAGFFVLIPPNMATNDLLKWQKEFADKVVVAVRKSGVKHVVVLSSVGADLKEGSGPVKGLHYLEEAIHKSGVKLTAIRPSYFQENVAHILGAAQKAGIYPSFFPADFEMPMVATRDIGNLVAESLMHPAPKSETVDLKGPTYSARQIATKLGDALGKKLMLIEVPPSEYTKALMEAGFSKHMAEVFAELYTAIANNRLVPRADRLVKGTTPIDTLLKALVAKTA